MKIITPVLTVIEEAAQRGLRDGMDAILERSNELAPELDGLLKESGEARVDYLTGQVSYKSPGYPYIRDQHENLDFQHPNGGQAKFLEQAADEVDVAAFVAAETRRELGGQHG